MPGYVTHYIFGRDMYEKLNDPDTERYPWTKMFDLDEIRYALSGAELVKKEED